MILEWLSGLRKKNNVLREAEKKAKEKVILKSGKEVFKLEAKALVCLLMDLEKEQYAKFIEIVGLSQDEFKSYDELLKFVGILQIPKKILSDPQYNGLVIVIESKTTELRQIAHDSLEDKIIVSPVKNMTLKQFLES